MAGISPYTKPTNKVIVFNPFAHLPTQMLKVQTATSMKPGALVKRYSTTDNQIIVNTVNNTPIGFLGYEETNPKYTTGASTPMAVTGTYAANDIVAVHNGPGVVYVGRIANGQHPYKGDLLVAAASGEQTAASAITLAQTASSQHISTTLTGSIGAQGPLVSITEEEIDASAAATTGMVRSLI